jgi:hypothetical protein
MTTMTDKGLRSQAGAGDWLEALGLPGCPSRLQIIEGVIVRRRDRPARSRIRSQGA